MVDSDQTALAKVTVTGSPLLVDVAGADGVAVAAAVATVKERAASARRPIARAANRHVAPPTVNRGSPLVILLEILTMSRCRPVTVCGSPRDPRTPLVRMHRDRMHPDQTHLRPGAATQLAAQEQTTVSQGRRVAAAVVVAVGAKAAAPLAAPRHLQQRAAARAPRAAVRAAPPRAAANVAAGEAVGVLGKSGVRHRRSNAGVAMNLPPWRADARRTTRAWSFSASRMPATTVAPVTSAIQPTMMTASLRAGSTKCLTYPVGWKRSESSSQVISMHAAVRPGVEREAVEQSREAIPRHAAARRKGRGNPDAAAARATNAKTCFRG